MGACTNRAHRDRWAVTMRKCNYSAFNGYRRTRSAYSEIWCDICGARWRTRAAYADQLPDYRG